MKVYIKRQIIVFYKFLWINPQFVYMLLFLFDIYQFFLNKYKTHCFWQ